MSWLCVAALKMPLAALCFVLFKSPRSGLIVCVSVCVCVILRASLILEREKEDPVCQYPWSASHLQIHPLLALLCDSGAGPREHFSTASWCKVRLCSVLMLCRQAQGKGVSFLPHCPGSGVGRGWGEVRGHLLSREFSCYPSSKCLRTSSLLQM